MWCWTTYSPRTWLTHGNSRSLCSQRRQCFVAMMTAFRVNEIHALARDVDKLRWNQDSSVSLATRDGFIAKNKRPTAAGQRVTLQPLSEQPDLYPVVHLRVYVEVTGSEEGSDHLFRPLRDPTVRMSPQTVSTWISTTIQGAYAFQRTRSTLGMYRPVPPLLWLRSLLVYY